jgi:Spy/CpxP family protein refolding chaperone
MNNKLCRFALSGLLATGLTLSASTLFAQDAAPAPDAAAQGPGGGYGRGGGRQPMDPDQQVARMTRRYNLSADQQAQIKPILANQQQQMMALRGDSSSSREDRMAKMKTIREDSSTKIQAILNDTQKQKFAEDQQKMQERMQQRMQERGAPPAQQ